jgi:KaiC/GvpD/RAD55 family RecA-like ATPase
MWSSNMPPRASVRLAERGRRGISHREGTDTRCLTLTLGISCVGDHYTLTRITSGITPIDAQLGGFIAGRVHVFVGVPGTGKTSATLHFLDAALRQGEPAALLTRDRGSDLISQAAHLGIDLRPALSSGLLSAVRYRSDFSSRLASGVPIGRVLDELRSQWSGSRATRIAINTCSPFLADGAPSDARMLALTEFLEGTGATSVITLPGELSTTSFDRRLEPLIDRAAAVLRFSREQGGQYRVDVVKVRQSFSSAYPMRFTIRSPNGIVAAEREVTQ